MITRLEPRQVADSLDELLAGAGPRRPYQTQETRSGSKFETVLIDGESFVIKYLHPDDDFALRAVGGTGLRAATAFGAGLFDVASDLIDHAIVGAARGIGRDGLGSAFMMRDVSAHLVPPGDAALPEDQHFSFLNHLAGMCAYTWGWRDDLGLQPYPARWTYFTPQAIEGERALGWPEQVPKIAAQGWARFAERAPADVVNGIGALHRDISPMADRLQQETPACFLHGDWKAGNLGSAPDGRTVLIDWVYLGAGPACHELGWYLALNAAKLPVGHSREQVITDFRAALESHDVATDGWWDLQLDLSLLGTLVQFGWEKALGSDAELAWWCDRARQGIARL